MHGVWLTLACTCEAKSYLYTYIAVVPEGYLYAQCGSVTTCVDISLVPMAGWERGCAEILNPSRRPKLALAHSSRPQAARPIIPLVYSKVVL